MAVFDSNAKLLTMLENLVHPIDQCTLTLEVAGVFAFSEEWKTIDEANPFFQYSMRFSGMETKDGKILPRQQTEKEIREAEEAAAAKKKGGKKDDKKLTPEEAEAIRRAQEEEEEAERRIKAEWDALDEDTKFYRTHEDKYKSASIRFETSTLVREKSED
eukprot:TRINITY_DN1715_c0_g3_i2.p1 TRINITY_DN1715_c0_g3~~TRINITY_DN1715_c0_g3_i2.p1  ORF type:complete len:160 (+),score=69.02 TRINITY_DN1715_c0_g3_i2:273-752(+)